MEGDSCWRKKVLRNQASPKNMPVWTQAPSVKHSSISEENFPQKSEKYSCLHAEWAFSCPRMCITAGLFNLLESPCPFYYFPRKKNCILLFHPEISALHGVARSPTSFQLTNIREIIGKPLPAVTGFCTAFFFSHFLICSEFNYNTISFVFLGWAFWIPWTSFLVYAMLVL